MSPGGLQRSLSGGNGHRYRPPRRALSARSRMPGRSASFGGGGGGGDAHPGSDRPARPAAGTRPAFRVGARGLGRHEPTRMPRTGSGRQPQVTAHQRPTSDRRRGRPWPARTLWVERPRGPGRRRRDRRRAPDRPFALADGAWADMSQRGLPGWHPGAIPGEGHRRTGLGRRPSRRVAGLSRAWPGRDGESGGAGWPRPRRPAHRPRPRWHR